MHASSNHKPQVSLASQGMPLGWLDGGGHLLLCAADCLDFSTSAGRGGGGGRGYQGRGGDFGRGGGRNSGLLGSGQGYGGRGFSGEALCCQHRGF